MKVISSKFVLASNLRTNNPIIRKNSNRATRVFMYPFLSQLQNLTEPTRYQARHLVICQRISNYQANYCMLAGYISSTIRGVVFPVK